MSVENHTELMRTDTFFGLLLNVVEHDAIGAVTVKRPDQRIPLIKYCPGARRRASITYNRTCQKRHCFNGAKVRHITTDASHLLRSVAGFSTSCGIMHEVSISGVQEKVSQVIQIKNKLRLAMQGEQGHIFLNLYTLLEITGIKCRHMSI